MDDAEIAETSERIEVKAKWDDDPQIPVKVATHFAASVGFPAADGEPDGVYLTMGHLMPPVLVGPWDEVAAQLTAGLTVGIQGKFYLTRSRLNELIGVLQKAAGQYDAVVAQSTEEGS